MSLFGCAKDTACVSSLVSTRCPSSIYRPPASSPLSTLCSFLVSCIARTSFDLDSERTSAVNDDDRSLKLSASNEELVVLVVRVVCLGLLGYWSLILIRPFLTIIVWSIIIAVALYPIFDWLSAKLYGHRALAAIAITVFTFFVMLGPATWLALSLAETVRMLLARLSDGTLAIPVACPNHKQLPGDRKHNWADK